MAMKQATSKNGGGKFGDATIFKFEAVGDELSGTLVEKGKRAFDDKDVNRYVVKGDDGTTYSFLGSFKLDELLEEVPVGARVEIKYTKKARLKGGKTLKEFDVMYDDEAVQSAGGEAA